MFCRYNGGLLEFHKSSQEIEDTDDDWFDIDPTEDEDLLITFKVRKYLRVTFHLLLIKNISDEVQFISSILRSKTSIFLLCFSFLCEKQP